MKSIMLSIRPQWVEKIVNGEKTIEVRKSRPKLGTPFKCYIYMTQGKFQDLGTYSDWIYKRRMSVIGEFVCDRIEEFIPTERGIKFKHFSALHNTCLTTNEMREYLGGKKGYGLHISDLKIYDKPKELGEFKKYSDCEFINECVNCIEYSEILESCSIDLHLTRPPQSWCYVEAE